MELSIFCVMCCCDSIKKIINICCCTASARERVSERVPGPASEICWADVLRLLLARGQWAISPGPVFRIVDLWMHFMHFPTPFWAIYSNISEKWWFPTGFWVIMSTTAHQCKYISNNIKTRRKAALGKPKIVYPCRSWTKVFSVNLSVKALLYYVERYNYNNLKNFLKIYSYKIPHFRWLFL